MKFWPFGSRERVPPPPDPAALQPVLPDGYDDLDRYRDFRAVFVGESTAEQGRRVLSCLLSRDMAHVWQPSMSADPHQTAFREGERNVGLKILAALGNPPGRKATKAAVRPRPTQR